MTSSGGSSRAGLLAIGVVAAIAGLAAGVLLIFIAPGSKLDDAVGSLAPAPVGCETSLEFDSSGTFYVFVEISGDVGDLGDCENDDRSYAYDGPEPALDVTLVDGEGDDVRLSDDDSVRYDRGGQVGQSLGTVRITSPGEYQLRVAGTGDDLDELMVRVGSDPNVSTSSLTIGGIAALIVGLGLGVTLIALGLRGGRTLPAGAPPAVAPAWQTPMQPTSPPTAPPTGPPPAGPPTAGSPSWAPQGQPGQSAPASPGHRPPGDQQLPGLGRPTPPQQPTQPLPTPSPPTQQPPTQPQPSQLPQPPAQPSQPSAPGRPPTPDAAPDDEEDGDRRQPPPSWGPPPG